MLGGGDGFLGCMLSGKVGEVGVGERSVHTFSNSDAITVARPELGLL